MLLLDDLLRFETKNIGYGLKTIGKRHKRLDYTLWRVQTGSCHFVLTELERRVGRAGTNGTFTLHGNRNGTGTGNVTGTIGDNVSGPDPSSSAV